MLSTLTTWDVIFSPQVSSRNVRWLGRPCNCRAEGHAHELWTLAPNKRSMRLTMQCKCVAMTHSTVCAVDIHQAGCLEAGLFGPLPLEQTDVRSEICDFNFLIIEPIASIQPSLLPAQPSCPLSLQENHLTCSRRNVSRSGPPSCGCPGSDSQSALLWARHCTCAPLGSPAGNKTNSMTGHHNDNLCACCAEVPDQA